MFNRIFLFVSLAILGAMPANASLPAGQELREADEAIKICEDTKTGNDLHRCLGDIYRLKEKRENQAVDNLLDHHNKDYALIEELLHGSKNGASGHACDFRTDWQNNDFANHDAWQAARGKCFSRMIAAFVDYYRFLLKTAKNQVGPCHLDIETARKTKALETLRKGYGPDFQSSLTKFEQGWANLADSSPEKQRACLTRAQADIYENYAWILR